MKAKLSFLVAALVLGCATHVIAGTSTATFQAAATLNAGCVVKAMNVNFGNMTPSATGTLSGSGGVVATCSKNLPYTLSISAGTSGDISSRTMMGAIADNKDKLSYNLYIDSAATNIWGDGATGKTITQNGAGAPIMNTIFGKLSLNQYLRPDTYTDNLTVTLTY